MKRLTTTICLTIAVLLGSAGQSFAEGKWFATKNQPNCSVWNSYPQPEETATWSGNCLKGKAHGKGTLTWRYKKNDKWIEHVFEGQYKDDKFHGQGTTAFANGDKYVGGFKDGDFNGQGTYTFADGNKYVGEWKDGKYDGHGTYTHADGRIEEGIFKDHKFQYAQKAAFAKQQKAAKRKAAKQKAAKQKAKAAAEDAKIKTARGIWGIKFGMTSKHLAKLKPICSDKGNTVSCSKRLFGHSRDILINNKQWVSKNTKIRVKTISVDLGKQTSEKETKIRKLLRQKYGLTRPYTKIELEEFNVDEKGSLREIYSMEKWLLPTDESAEINCRSAVCFFRMTLIKCWRNI